MAEEPNDGDRQRKTISTYDITTLDNLDHLIMQVQLKVLEYYYQRILVRISEIINGVSENISKISKNIKYIYLE